MTWARRSATLESWLVFTGGCDMTKKISRFGREREEVKAKALTLKQAMVAVLRERKHVFELLAAYDRGEWEPQSR